MSADPSPEQSAWQALEQRLGHNFAERDLLRLALTHRSFGASNNERLEFLGDSIVNFVIGERLFQRFPQAPEGQLSRLRSQLVKGDTLAEVGQELGLGDYLLLGDGERKSGGQRRDSILADCVEAVLGAIYLDAGLSVCAERIDHWYAERIAALSLNDQGKDAKTRLQELMQARGEPLPIYRVVNTRGQAHQRTFTVECQVPALQEPAHGEAPSRREAEKRAAEQVLARLAD